MRTKILNDCIKSSVKGQKGEKICTWFFCFFAFNNFQNCCDSIFLIDLASLLPFHWLFPPELLDTDSSPRKVRFPKHFWWQSVKTYWSITLMRDPHRFNNQSALVHHWWCWKTLLVSVGFVRLLMDRGAMRNVRIPSLLIVWWIFCDMPPQSIAASGTFSHR